MDAGEEALVGDEEEGEAGGLVDAAGLGFDDAVFDLVAHAEAVAAADCVGCEQEGDGVGEVLAVEGDGEAFFEADGDFFGFDVDVGTPEGDAHDGGDDLHGGGEQARGPWLRGWRRGGWSRWSRPSRSTSCSRSRSG